MYLAAKHYGVSDVALRKMCLQLDVPVPRRGHWNRVAAGHEIMRPTLPASSKTESRVDRWENEAVGLVASEEAHERSRAVARRDP